MRKEDNHWSLYHRTPEEHVVSINSCDYEVDTKTAAICHAILLLVDAINDKKDPV